jgi:hypothetical protein
LIWLNLKNQLSRKRNNLQVLKHYLPISKKKINKPYVFLPLWNGF